jgi:hypothetical protein
MSLKDVKPGQYIAKAIDGVFNNNKEGTAPRIEVRFEFEHGPDNAKVKDKIIKKMFLGEKPGKDGLTMTERAFNTLYGILGLDESKPFIRLTDGSDYFDEKMLANKQVQITIELQTDKHGAVVNDKNGDPYREVSWVNELGGGQLSGVSVQQVVGNIDLKAAAAAARARMGAKKPPAAPAATFTDDTIPIYNSTKFRFPY